MHQHQSLGLVIRVHAVYETPFWREAGLSGTCFNPTDMVQEIYNNTNYQDPRGTLVAFVPDEPVGPIYWTSPDLAAEGCQHVDGAVRMGLDTARRMVAAGAGSSPASMVV